MTREEAIKWFIRMKESPFVPLPQGAKEAIDMAIEALQEPKTIIGIDIPYGSDKGLATVFKGNEKMVLEEVKEIMSVVRCKDCDRGFGSPVCPIQSQGWAINQDTFYCAWGESKEEDGFCHHMEK